MQLPLAERLRPTKISQMVGQEHLLKESSAFKAIIESNNIPNMIFYGPSGTGKTTLASIIANNSNMTLRKLNGTTASISDIRDICDEIDTFSGQNGILLYLDEIQYFNKKQQQTLLQFIENGDITLIASTTENPYFYIYSAILSRSTVFEFKTVSKKEIEKAVIRAVEFLEDERKEEIKFSLDEVSYIALMCSGDVRKAINLTELCVLATPKEGKARVISFDTVKQLIDTNSLAYDKDGDNHYDILSAFQKSMRGSDPDAAVHYLARLLEAGDMLSAIRRLLVCACEDVGLAYPSLIAMVKACTDIALQVGMPEARIPLADAVIMVSNSPKSNTGYLAINNAIDDLKSGYDFDIPRHLQNTHFDGEDNKQKGQFYKYPHEFDNSYIKQQYLPDSIKDKKYYEYGNNKTEQAYKNYWDKIKL